MARHHRGQGRRRHASLTRSFSRARLQRTTVVLAAVVVALAGCGTTGTTVTASQLASSTQPAPAACPVTAPPDRAGADTAGVLVPGHPATVLVCPYPGVNPLAPGSPAPKPARTDGAALARLVNALPEPPGGIMHCGADTGERDVLYFVYAATGRALQVNVERTGCRSVASTFGRRWSPPGDLAATRLTDRLGALTGA